ncbi:hypothetical protein AcW1_000015 [Taiwanofungus camphoratus]|nr:hypothetical protein AcW1_000015 [Antrodia cinnamomea]
MSCNSAVVYAPEDSSEEDVSSSSTAASSVASLESHPLPPSFENPKLQYPPLPKDFPPLPLNKTPEEPAYADLQTPDRWVKRNPELVRLTGKHPFNAEAPIPSLFSAGFITPSHLHFVRNHGAVPTIDEEKLRDWKIRIHGLVEHECSFTLQELKRGFEVVTLPVTLVCAGNRRKEQNILRKSLGFSWGSGGVSTALWTGVYLSDILNFVKPIRGRAKHVIFEGGDTNLPNGPYGTSQRLSWAASREKGMLIAWAMNGLPLDPDHGFPVRLIVPGQIGGRSVKWLTRIEVSARESQHHLHFFDNKVLPMQLSPEQARSEKHWWYDPKYIITELNVNSTITRPDHDEVLDFDATDSNTAYMLQGYAYAGGGRRINRIEVSIDGGTSWSIADVEYPEDLYRSRIYSDDVYGRLDLTDRDTCFCWCFWSFRVPVRELADASFVAVRAMDEGMSTQPRDMYPNPTSMMNNWWFRVAIVKTTSGVRFEHPAPVGRDSLGWMERLKESGQDILKPELTSLQSTAGPTQKVESAVEVSMTNPAIARRITMSELKAQDHKRPWFVVKGEVYDGTGYLDEHPGGADSIFLVAGGDATDDFMAIHSADAKSKLQKYHIGTLIDALDEPTRAEENTAQTMSFLNPKVWKSVKLTEIQTVNHDTCFYRFVLSNPQQPLGLPVGQHVFVRLKRKDTGEMVQRAYTPVSKQDAVGFIDFLIKLYLPCKKFPAGGKMTMGFNQLQVGDTIELKGPLGSFVWQGRGSATWKGVPRRVKEVGLVCGGSGITPILQVLRSIVENPHDSDISIWLLYANKTEADILCREELHKFYELNSHRFHLHHTLSTVPQQWVYSSGRITDGMIASHLPRPSPDALILACGPAGMITEALRPGLQKHGWDTEKSLVIF